MLSSLTSPSVALVKTSSRLILRACWRASDSAFRRWPRCWASCRARRSFSTASKCSPASQTPSSPRTSTGSPGLALSTRAPVKSSIALTLPQFGPATSASPTCRAPRSISTVATGPRPGSRWDSITTPDAGADGFAFSSSSSAAKTIISSRLSNPSLVFAETSQKIVSPPQSSGVSPCEASSLRTRSGCAPSLSILFTATRIGTPAARAWSIASTV